MMVFKQLCFGWGTLSSVAIGHFDRPEKCTGEHQTLTDVKMKPQGRTYIKTLELVFEETPKHRTPIFS